MKREIIIEREQIREVNLDRKKEQFRELCGTEDSIRELFKLLYIDKIATKEELKNLFTKNTREGSVIYCRDES